MAPAKIHTGAGERTACDARLFGSVASPLRNERALPGPQAQVHGCRHVASRPASDSRAARGCASRGARPSQSMGPHTAQLHARPVVCQQRGLCVDEWPCTARLEVIAHPSHTYITIALLSTSWSTHCSELADTSVHGGSAHPDGRWCTPEAPRQ